MQGKRIDKPLVNLVEHIKPGIECLTPQSILRSGSHIDYSVMLQPHRIGRISLEITECIAVKFFQAVPCGNPYETVFVLHHVLYHLLRQTLTYRIAVHFNKIAGKLRIRNKIAQQHNQ